MCLHRQIFSASLWIRRPASGPRPLAGLRAFIAKFNPDPDFPVIPGQAR